MDGGAPMESVAPGEKPRSAGGTRFTMPLPRKHGTRKAGGLPRRIVGECVGWIVVAVVALVMVTPIPVLLVAGGWGMYTYVRTLLMLWHQVQAYQISDLTPLLDSLDRAGRMALASAGYFALLCALIVLMAGLLGKSWRRLFLFPGVVFTLPSAFAFFFGLQLSLDTLVAPSHLSDPLRAALVAYLLLDAVVLAAVLVDVSPRRRRRARHGRPVVATAPLAPVHFGPSRPRANRARKLATSKAAVPEIAKIAAAEAPATPIVESASTPSSDEARGSASGTSSPLAEVS